MTDLISALSMFISLEVEPIFFGTGFLAALVSRCLLAFMVGRLRGDHLEVGPLAQTLLHLLDSQDWTAGLSGGNHVQRHGVQIFCPDTNGNLWINTPDLAKVHEAFNRKERKLICRKAKGLFRSIRKDEAEVQRLMEKAKLASLCQKLGSEEKKF